MKRAGIASRFGALVAMAGSAVGLGNLWRFPYLVGENGAAADNADFHRGSSSFCSGKPVIAV